MAFEPKEPQKELKYEELRIYTDEELNNYTDEELKKRKRKTVLAYASVAASFAITASLIVLTCKGLGTTLAFIKGLLR